MTMQNTGAPAGVNLIDPSAAPPATPAPAAPTPPAIPAPPQPATPPPAAAAQGEPDPHWLKGRLDRERAKALKEAGFENEADAKSAAAARKAAADATKTADQRASEAAAQLAVANAELETQRAATREYAARMVAGLTPEQKAAVDALAGDDPAKQIQSITALAPTWAAAGAAKPTASLPTTTAPPAAAPNGAAPPVPNERVTYDQMRTTNPFAAARFGTSNPRVYDPK